MASLPACAAPCFISAIANSTCGPQDTACQCSSPQLVSQARACVQSSCSIRDALATANATSIECGLSPIQDKSALAPLIAFTAIAAIAVILRPVSRALVIKNKFGWDDMFNLVGAAICFAAVALVFYCFHIGLGTEVWAVPPDNITIILRSTFFFMLLYGLCRFFTRLSIILFYIRVFELTDAAPYLQAALIFNLAVGIVLVFVMCFQCAPLDHFWLRWDRLHPGYCIDANMYTLAQGIIEVAEDIFLIVLPFPFLRHLRLSWCKRLSVTTMFAVGLLTFIISVVRLPTIMTFTLSANVTLDGVHIAVWSILEMDLSLICACLPTLYPLLRHTVGSLETLTRRSGPKVDRSFYIGQSREDYIGGVYCGPEVPDRVQAKRNSFRAWGVNTISDITLGSLFMEQGESSNATPNAPTPETASDDCLRIDDDIGTNRWSGTAQDDAISIESRSNV